MFEDPWKILRPVGFIAVGGPEKSEFFWVNINIKIFYRKYFFDFIEFVRKHRSILIVLTSAPETGIRLIYLEAFIM